MGSNAPSEGLEHVPAALHQHLFRSTPTTTRIVRVKRMMAWTTHIKR